MDIRYSTSGWRLSEMPQDGPSLPPIFVISLERAATRRSHMERLVAQLGLEVEFVPAVDGRRLTADQRARYDRDRTRSIYGCDMTDAEIGCYLSHFGVYEKMAAERIDVAVVLEDDIECDGDLADLIRDLAAQREPAWTVVRLQSTKSTLSDPKTAKTRGETLAHIRGRSLCRVGTSVLGGCGYIIRRPAAEAMLKYGRRIFMPIDQTLDRYWENGISPVVLRPFPIRQAESFESTIGVRGRAAMAAPGPWLLIRRRTRRALDGLNKRLFAIAQKGLVWGGRVAGSAAPKAWAPRKLGGLGPS
jgi:glycosyl transferase family 25